METIKFHTKTDQPIIDWETTPITTKMEAISKWIARIIYEENKKLGGTSFKFTVSDIYDKETKEPLGTVTIKWEK